MTQQEKAALWAGNYSFTPSDVDCITAITLKILDGKCKMGHEEQACVWAIYEFTRYLEGQRLEGNIHTVIYNAREIMTEALARHIHELRKHAEACIEKPVMKAFKAVLRQSLAA